MFIPGENNHKVEDVVKVRKVHPREGDQLYYHLHHKYNGNNYVTDN